MARREWAPCRRGGRDVETYWVWEYGLFEKNPKRQDSLNPETTLEVVKAADAQATIAALQARVTELEAIKIPDDAFTYCAYCGEKSPVDEHNEDLSAHIKVCPKHPIRDVEAQLTQRTTERDTARRRVDELEAREVDVVMLREDLEQRTAELEAIEKILDIDSGKTTVEKVRDLHHSFKQVWESYQDASNEMFKAQAELERVRALVKTYADAKIDFDDKRLQEDHHAWRERYNKLVEAENAMLQHRQGMEG